MLPLSKLKILSKHDFAALGYSDFGYVKRVESNGSIAYAAHAADGTYLWQFGDRGQAEAMLREHEVEPFSLH